MTGWTDLDRELDRWADAGRVATFWWRDDDAVAATEPLERLLAIARGHQVAPMLAVIPALATAPLATRLSGEPVFVAQHGYRHHNYALPLMKKAEFAGHRSVGYMLGELARGAAVLDKLFGSTWLPVLVPPYNRIASRLVTELPSADYIGLSTYGPRLGVPPARLAVVNTHVDIIDWWFTQSFVGLRQALALVVNHLSARREGRCDRAEPTGLLTHHLAHDNAAWEFTAALIKRVGTHRAARWLDPREAFAPARAAQSAAQ